MAAAFLLPFCFPLWPLPPLPMDRWAHLPSLSHLQRFPSERAAREQIKAHECRIEWLREYRTVCPWRQREPATQAIEALTDRLETWRLLADAWDEHVSNRLWWTSDNEFARRVLLDTLRRKLGDIGWRWAEMPGRLP